MTTTRIDAGLKMPFPIWRTMMVRLLAASVPNRRSVRSRLGVAPWRIGAYRQANGARAAVSQVPATAKKLRMQDTSGPPRHNLRTRTWVAARNHRRITAPHTRTFNHGAALGRGHRSSEHVATLPGRPDARVRRWRGAARALPQHDAGRRKAPAGFTASRRCSSSPWPRRRCPSRLRIPPTAHQSPAKSGAPP